jgi:hypothetical protein
MFDSGVDPNDPESGFSSGGGGFHNPNDIFNMFFSGGGFGGQEAEFDGFPGGSPFGSSFFTSSSGGGRGGRGGRAQTFTFTFK